MTLLEYPRALFTADEFDRMIETGAVGPRRVILINGEMVEMPAQGEAHVAAFTRATIVFNRHFSTGSGWTARYSAPLRVSRFSQPEPDVVIVRDDDGRLLEGQRPTRAELVVEISHSTLEDDRGVMKQLYAQAGTPDYWIVNLRDRRLEVHRRPNASRGDFDDHAIFLPGESVAPLAKPEALINVAELLP